ncbi:MAG: hypothetical protein AAGB25_00525 [Pseudomonadota bacterium]
MYYDDGLGSSKLATMPMTMCRETSAGGDMIRSDLTYHDILGDIHGIGVAAADRDGGLRETYAMPGEATLSIYERGDYGGDGADRWNVILWGEEFDGEEVIEVQLKIEREQDQLWIRKSARAADDEELSLRHRVEFKLETE